MKRAAVFCFFLFAWRCSFAQPGVLLDAKATAETKALARNLYLLSKDHILFGHQHATEYGHGWSGDDNRSDVRSVTGSHPAVIGVDVSGLSGRGEKETTAEIDRLSKIVADTYDRGGVTTVSWHFNNPASAGGFYWKDSLSVAAVPLLLPKGRLNGTYKTILQAIALFANSSKGSDGKLVPMIFRPFHEFDGWWFWWGKPYCTKEDFRELWQFTVSYLRDSLHVHNFIYAFSPDCLFYTEDQFAERYPGDAWVDMVGFDDYHDFGRDGYYALDSAIVKLQVVSAFAAKHRKLAALTETGLESIPNTSWWTNVLLKTIRSSGARLSYVLVWRNDSSSPTHYYAPFPGQVSEADFIRFYNDPFTLFENNIRDIYHRLKIIP